LGLGLEDWVSHALARIDFNDALMNGMLSFLLFAGALHVNLNDLAKQKWVVTTLATVGVTLSTFIVGYLGYVVFNAVGLEMPLILPAMR
jgi:CPA1 family monovalent cation:H+ antiporter